MFSLALALGWTEHITSARWAGIECYEVTTWDS